MGHRNNLNIPDCSNLHMSPFTREETQEHQRKEFIREKGPLQCSLLCAVHGTVTNSSFENTHLDGNNFSREKLQDHQHLTQSIVSTCV